jgi:hypothetical protein
MENLTNWCIYMHENRVNGKKYIGITCQKPTKRWNNGNGYSQNAHFYAAIKKHGWDAFRHDILFTNLTQEEAERLEIELIAKYGTLDPDKGYNLDPGGSVRHPTAETREKLREAHLGQKPTAANRQSIVAAVKGKPKTEEHRRKISQARGGREIRCVETGEVFMNAYEVQRATGINARSVRQVCTHVPHHKTAGGLHWEYVEPVSIT